MSKRQPKPRPAPPRPAQPRDAHGGPDATLVADHDRGDKSGRRAGEEKIFGDHCIGLVRRAWGLPTVQPFARPSAALIDAHDGDRGSTPNKRGLLRIWDYGAAMWSESQEEADAARWRLVDFFAKQRTTEGHQYAEENTSSHGQLWALIGASAHALALHYGDEALLDETGEWWRREADLCDKLLDHDGHRTGPCGRSAGSTYDIGTWIAHALQGTEPPEFSLIPNARGGVRLLTRADTWTDSYWAGPWMALRMIQRDLETLGGATHGRRSPVLLRDEMHIYRRGPWYVKVFPRMRSSEALFWTARLPEPPSVPHVKAAGSDRYDAPHRSGRFPDGLDNPYPAPVLEGATLTIIEGVR